jgi:pimeloyl-ACP methyl ester carboxylesterase
MSSSSSSSSSSSRISTITSHLIPNNINNNNNITNNPTINSSPCIGESSNLVVEKNQKYQRVALKIVFPDASTKDERYGGSGDLAVIEGELLLPPTKSKTVIVFMHPSGIQFLLPMPNAMARAGLHVVACCSRYPNNDTCVIMEKILFDLAACVKELKTKFKYEKVILAGWSGGGSLSSFYQSQAENPTVFSTPAGEPIDFRGKLIPADGMLIMAAHASRAQIFTEWIDPAVLDENDPDVRDPSLDLWNPQNKPPYSKEFITRFRAAQVARNQRITKYALAKLASLKAQEHEPGWKTQRKDHPFIVRCTQADPRRLDLSLDPNGRQLTSLEELASENHSPVGLARFTTCKAWLSQWSVEYSNGNGPRHLARVSVPIMVLANEADHLVPSTHPKAMYAAISHHKKKYVEIPGATHYYFGQHQLMNQGVKEAYEFLLQYNLIEPGLLLGL